MMETLRNWFRLPADTGRARVAPRRPRLPLGLEALEDRNLLSASLVAAYNFDEGSGLTLHDVSGSGNNGTVANATWSAAGKFGGALAFNGSNAWVTVSNSTSLSLTSGMTLEAWVNPSTRSGFRDVLLKERPGGLSYALYAADSDVSGSPPDAEVNTGGRDRAIQGPAGLPLNAWSFLAATYNGSSLQIYVNGDLVNSLAVSGNIVETSGALRIGGNSVWGEYFKGLIDNVRIYNGAISQAQIKSDMTTPVGSSSSAPVASAGPSESGQEGAALTFAGSVTGGVAPFVYSWSFGDGGTASGTLVPSHVYQDAGTYTTTLTVTDSLGHISSSSTTATAGEVTPTAGAGGPYSGAPGSAIAFAGSATDSPTDLAGMQYAWSFGDGSTGTGQTASHAYAAAGTYTATLTVTDPDGLTASSSATATVTGSAPVASAGPNQSGPEGTALTFAGSVQGGAAPLTYLWDFGDGGTASGTLTPSHTYAEAGIYTATLTVTDSLGRRSTSSATATAGEVTPTASAGGPYSGNAGTAVTFSGSATDSPTDLAGMQYAWSFGDGSTGTGQSPTHAYAAGTYTATLTVTDPDGLTASASATVSVGNAAPVASAGPKQSGNEGTPLTFSGSVTGGAAPFTYSWSFGDGGTASGTLTPSHTYQDAGTFTTTLTVTDALGRSSTASTTATAGEVTPTASAGGPYSGNAGAAVSFTGSATDAPQDLAGMKYAWSFGDGGTSTAQSPSHAYAAAGTYTATLTVTDPDGLTASSSATATVTAQSPPAANAGPSESGQEGAALTFAGSVTGGVAPFVYSWSFGDGGTASGTLAPSHVYQDAGAFTVTLTVTDALGRSSTASTTATANEVTPTANAGGPYSGTPGAAVSFTGSATDAPQDLAGMKYAWSFGDGSTGTGQTASHAYAAAGTYTATLTVTDPDGLTASSSAAVTVQSGTFDNDPFLVTPWDKIPNFGAKPTDFSVKSGNWSDPSVWSAGRLPAAGDVVDVNPGTAVTYDVMSSAALNTLEVQAGGSLKFRTDVNTELVVGNFLVLQGGYLEIGTQANPVAANVLANVIIANQPINTAADPSQYGTGLIVLGKMTSYGAPKTAYATLAQEAHAGDTAVRLAAPVTGWQPSDDLFLPDTRDLDWNQRADSNGPYVPQWEELSVQSVSADGLTVTLTAPLKYDHLGARDAAGNLRYLPQLVNRERSIMIGSVNEGVNVTRGQVMFTDRADVNVNYTGFCELGRTTGVGANGNPVQPDNTTYGGSGNVTHLGTNQDDRLPVNFRHLMGPTTAQADGYQYTFVGNVMDDDSSTAEKNQTIKWGLNIDDSHYGLIQDNVVYNWAGAGINLEQGNESYNVIAGNFVARVTGSGVREDLALSGAGYWITSPLDYVHDNVATDINVGGTYSYGYDINLQYDGVQAVPAFQGADTSVAAQTKAVNMNAAALLQFANNTVYGATPNGLTYWWLDTDYTTPQAGPGSVIQGLTAWNFYQWGVFGYESNQLTIAGATLLGSAAVMAGGSGGAGLYFSDYQQVGLTVTGADVENLATGIGVPAKTLGTAFTVANSYLADQTDVDVGPIYDRLSTSDWLSPRTTVVSGVKFGAAADGSPLSAISMDFVSADQLATLSANLMVSDRVLVYNYGGVSGDNFQAYYSQQASGYVVPQTRYNSDGSIRLDACPQAGMTNQQAWATYRLAIAGAVAPSAAAPRAGITNGLVVPI